MKKTLSTSSVHPLLKQLPPGLKRAELTSGLLRLAQAQGDEAPWRREAIDQLMGATRLMDVIPDCYRDYRQIVYDGIGFLLSHISLNRFVELIVDQALLPAATSAEERLVSLIRRFPTLHKLGQIIARNRNIDPNLRRQLIQLEHALHGTDVADVRGIIAEEIGQAMSIHAIEIGERILAEASVGVVVPFRWCHPATGQSAQGVFKLLKPGIRTRLFEELQLLDEAARYFETHKTAYAVKDFRFVSTFQDVKQALQNEINLAGEQAYLKAAAVYRRIPGVTIPAVLPFSTPKLTAMARVDGWRITDSAKGEGRRRLDAWLLFRTIVGSPLFSRSEHALFHGDPHAGNLYALKAMGPAQDRVALLDWSMAGYLSRKHRINLVRMIIGVLTRDPVGIYQAVAAVSEDNLAAEPQLALQTKKIIGDLLARQEQDTHQIVARTFGFIDQMGQRGVRFPRDFLLFRKAIFTLEGVLQDLDPAFELDAYMIRLLAEMFLTELPQRCANALLPFWERAQDYQTMISNSDLQRLVFQQMVDSFKRGTDLIFDCMRRNLALWHQLAGMRC